MYFYLFPPPKHGQRLDKGFSARGKRVAQVPKYTFYFNGHYLDAITTTRVQVELLGHMKIVEGAISFLSNNTPEQFRD